MKDILNKLKSTPGWFSLPSLIVAFAVGLTIAGYTPLVFDPSLYQNQSALANDLTTINADELEKSKSSSVKGDGEIGELQDGTWTGYAPCGEGNSDGWRPYYVAVTVEVKDKKVVGITSIEGTSNGEAGSTPLTWDASENQQYLSSAINGVQPQIEAQIAESNGSVSGIDTVSGATYSSTAIYNAYSNALRKAAGETVEATTVQDSASSGSTSENINVGDLGAITANGLADGTWTGSVACGVGNDRGWSPYYVTVTITVKDGKVVAITDVSGSSSGEPGDPPRTWNPSENGKYLSWATSGRDSDQGVKSQINSKLKSGSAITSIDTVSGATYSSIAIYNAYVIAVKKAAAANNGAQPGTQEDQPEAKKKLDRKAHAKSTEIGGNPGVNGNTKLADGTFTGYYRCTEKDQFDYYIALDVTVKNGKVTKIANVRPTMRDGSGNVLGGKYDKTNDPYLEKAINGYGIQVGVVSQIMNVAKTGKIPQSIDAVSGATYSSKGILQAYYDALKKSAKKAKSNVDVPEDKPSDEDPNEDDPGNEETPPEIEVPKEFADGDYTEYALCQNTANPSQYTPYYIGVTINVTDGKVTAITDVFGDKGYNASQNKSYLDSAIKGYGLGARHKAGVKEQINNALAQGTVPSTCDTVSGATQSSVAIIKAYQSALKSAKDKASEQQDDKDGKSDASSSAASAASSGLSGESAGKSAASSTPDAKAKHETKGESKSDEGEKANAPENAEGEQVEEGKSDESEQPEADVPEAPESPEAASDDSASSNSASADSASAEDKTDKSKSASKSRREGSPEEADVGSG